MFDNIDRFLGGFASNVAQAALRGLENAIGETPGDGVDEKSGTIHGASFIDVAKLPPEKRTEFFSGLQVAIKEILSRTPLFGSAIRTTLIDAVAYLQAKAQHYSGDQRSEIERTLLSKFHVPQRVVKPLVDIFEMGVQFNAIRTVDGTEHVNLKQGCFISCAVTSK